MNRHNTLEQGDFILGVVRNIDTRALELRLYRKTADQGAGERLEDS